MVCDYSFSRKSLSGVNFYYCIKDPTLCFVSNDYPAYCKKCEDLIYGSAIES